MHTSDDLYLGGFYPSGLTLGKTNSENPTLNQGVGPAGRVFFWNIVPAAIGTTNIAALAAPTSGIAMTLAAGAGVTVGTAPDGSGATVYQFDVPRAVSLTSGSDLHLINFLIVGYDFYGQKLSQLKAGPNGNTVNTLKAFASVLSITPQGTSASTLSAGSSDIFGLPYVIKDAGYIVQAKWNNTLAANAGTLVTADSNPATNLTGDVRGTFAQAGAASDGAKRLVICMHLDGTQCGAFATQTNLLGVAEA
jgi:hypothetical protein